MDFEADPPLVSLSPTPCSAHTIIKSVGQAARYGDITRLRELIVRGNPVDCGDNRGWKPTHEAAFGNHSECLKLLLQQEATFVDWESFEGKSALLIAAEEGSKECAELLLHHGANPNQADSMDNYPILAAVKQKSLPMVEMFVQRGADVNAKLYCGTTPLHHAASEGMSDIVKYLIDNDAKLDAYEEYSITPIFSAAQFGHDMCLRLILEKAVEIGQGSLVNRAADDGATPIFLAAQEGNTACVKTLLDFYADANLFTRDPKALPLHAAVQFNHIECVKLLLPVTDPDIVNECDITPYYFSVAHGDAMCTELLSQNGTPYDTRHKMLNDDEYEPKVLRYFQSNVRFSKRVTPITLIALYEGHIANALALFKAGCRVNPQSTYEVAPLLPALDTFNFELAELLIAHGANLNLYHPKIKGNLAVLVCLHNWKGLELVLKCGAEVKSLFGKDRRFQLENMCTSSNILRQRMSMREDYMSASEEEDYEQEIGEPVGIKSGISFWKVLAEARYIMSRKGVSVGKALYRILQFIGSVQLDPRILSYLESEEEIKELNDLVGSPRPLVHLCRLSIRGTFGSQRLLDESNVRSLPLPTTLLDFVSYKDVF